MQIAPLNPPPDHGEESYRGCDRLRGRAAIVTESDSGIGRAVAIAFAREGADVLIAYLGQHPGEHEGAQETADWVARAGRRAVRMSGDIRDGRYREALIATAMAEFGQLDILVNNSALEWAHESAEALDVTQIEHTFRTNSESVFFLSKTAASRMKRGSSIIHTHAMRAAHPASQLRAYATNEGAITNFTASLAQSLAKDGIRVNAVVPGPVWAPRIVATLSPEDVARFGADTLLGRPAQPAELAPAYVFLASNEASFVTGCILLATGGV